MNFSKLLCLVLVFSQQFGQVLLTETNVQTTEDCTGDNSKTVTCKLKKDKKVKLTIGGTVSTPVEWKKGTTTITAETGKYELDSDNSKILTILNLAEGDEGTYTAGVTPAENFQVQVVPVCDGKQSGKVTCKGKPGGELELKISTTATGEVTWKKGEIPINPGTKYTMGTNKVPLTIKDLEADDEGEYTASGGGLTNTEVFTVQVATICTGSSSSPQACVGTLNKDLILKVGSTATKKVVWDKSGTPVSGGKYVKSGTDDIALRITNLEADDAGTYTAAYDNTDTKETFAVSFPSTNEGGSGGGGSGGGTTKKPTTTGGGGRGSTTDTVVVHDNSGGSGSVLSYSPALLVTVTLVHLLLQLAA